MNRYKWILFLMILPIVMPGEIHPFMAVLWIIGVIAVTACGYALVATVAFFTGTLSLNHRKDIR